MNHIRNIRILSYTYLLFFALDDNPYGLYFALPWILYLLRESYLLGFSSKQALSNFALILFFIITLFYDKSKSSLYHPLIKNEIVLLKNIYISKGYSKGKLSASDNNFTLRDNPQVMVLLPKGEKIHINSFIRQGFTNFFPYYDIEVKTAHDQEILQWLDPKGTTKGYKKGLLYLWSNSSFYALGMLSNTLVDRYSITINPLFKLLSFLYPFALLYLLAKGFQNGIKNIQKKFGFHPFSLIIYALSYYYVLMASTNDGFSGFYLGLPYAFFLLWEIFMLPKKNKVRYLHIFVLLLSLYLLLFDRTHSKLLYPMVGKSYTIVKDVNYTYGNFYANSIDVYDFTPLDFQKPMFQFHPNDSFEIVSQKVAGHPDMGTTYIYQIRSKNFSILRKYLSEHPSQIKSKYFGDKNAFYIHSYELSTLLKTQGYSYFKPRFDNGFTYMSFYLLIYPIVLLLFFMMLRFRNRSVFKSL
ncbi:hypothetical protein MNB_SV-4-1336 [hydrothermal vent metagenome]|uniref:Uncharacterized protein n=1 Tax=hydrothermal vent metagenome TaxID=652676 RepID=A0A1W1E912_9ZZZZ